jgi:hypothetical protein
VASLSSLCLKTIRFFRTLPFVPRGHLTRKRARARGRWRDGLDNGGGKRIEGERERERGKGVLPCVARASEPFYPLVAGSGGCTSCTCAYACIHPPSCAHSRARCTRRARSCTRRRRYLSLSLSLSASCAHVSARTHTRAHTHAHDTRAIVEERRASHPDVIFSVED